MPLSWFQFPLLLLVSLLFLHSTYVAYDYYYCCYYFCVTGRHSVPFHLTSAPGIDTRLKDDNCPVLSMFLTEKRIFLSIFVSTKSYHDPA